jgi:methionyl-tRNA formyltransferase
VDIKDKTSLVFFGSGPVSKASLESLKESFEIEAIVTKPATEADMLSAAPNTPVFAIKNRKQLTNLVKDKAFQSKVAVVVDFGIIIEQEAIDYFPLGIINSHFSLLPRWRGADPISFAILAGDKQTGVSLMLIDESLDTGQLIAQESLTLLPRHTTPGLTNDLIELSNRMLADYLPKYLVGQIKPYPQPDSESASYSRKLEKGDGIIDWQKPAEQIEREIRAYAGWPKSTSRIGPHTVILVSAEVINKKGRPGAYQTGKKSLIIFCGDKALDIKSVQPPGKKTMPISAFLAGYKL